MCAIRSAPSTARPYEIGKIYGDGLLYRKLMFLSEHIHAEKLEVEIKLREWALTRGRFSKVQFRTLQKMVLHSLELAGDRREHRE